MIYYLIILLTIGIFSLTLITNPTNAELSCPDCGSDDPKLSNININAHTQNSSYENGDRVVVSGSITNFDYSTHSDIALSYRVLDTTGNIVTLGQTFPNPKGVFSFDFVAGGSLFKLSGDYPIQLIFGSVNDEISMTYTGGEFQSALPPGPSSTLPPTFNPRGLSDAIITITIKGDSIFYLDSPNAIIRGNVEIFDFSPSDGYYFMKVTHLPTQKVLKDFEIYPKYSGNDLWSVQIAYPILDTDIQFGGQTLYGEFQIEVTSEYGGQTGRTSFFIFESPDYSIIKIPEWVKNNAKWWADGLIDDKTFVSGIQFLIKEKILNVDTIQSTTSNTNSQVPQWIKTNADWWARGLITDGDFLKGIEYLVKNNIIDVSEKSPYQSQEDSPYKIPTGIVQPIIVTTDKTSYSEGETILVTGEVSEILFGYTISLMVYAPNGDVVAIEQVKVDSDKTYSTELTAGGSLMKTSGEYTIQVLYATENRAAETTFTFGGSTMTEQDNLFPVSGNDFMVGYKITGGKLISITPDSDAKSLIIAIDTTDDGQLTITLPRALIDSKYGGTDDDFFVLVNNEQVDFLETTTSVDRDLVISFTAGTEEIEIIGSFVSR